MREGRTKTIVGVLRIALGVPWLAGCSVPQKPGNGRVLHRVESSTRRAYSLYLPESFTAEGGQYPLVVSFHGMRPFDNHVAHIRQWQQEADRYGLVVCAPRLQACDVLREFPIRDPESAALRADEKATLAIMDEVCEQTGADGDRVLVTSFSSGGYIAHYMLNRHPDRFDCLASFQSNFNASLLLPENTEGYRDAVVAILASENDLPVVRKESQHAVNWYRAHGFRRLICKRLLGLGHERTPEVAASVFAHAMNLRPTTPPDVMRFMVADIESEPSTNGANQASSSSGS